MATDRRDKAMDKQDTVKQDPRCTCREGKDPVHPLWCEASPYRNRGRVVDLDAVVAKLSALGVTAFVESTGGGCATVFVGQKTTDAYGADRYPVVVGPGWFVDGHARGLTTELVYGPDDDGEQTPEEVGASWSATDLARHIARLFADDVIDFDEENA